MDKVLHDCEFCGELYDPNAPGATYAYCSTACRRDDEALDRRTHIIASAECA